jgi:prefoldin subunit 5
MAETSPLPQRLEQRLKALRQELETGQKMLADLEARRLELQQTILRIGGAIQVLEELLAAEPSAANGVAPAETAAPTNALVEADA